MSKLYKIDFKYRPRYFDGSGNKLVGVTTAINKLAKPALTYWAYNLGVEGKDMQEYMSYTQRLGTIIHGRIFAYKTNVDIDKSNITPDEWDASTEGFNSFVAWFQHENIKPIFLEKPFSNGVFGGTMDEYGLRDDIPTIVDYKSGKNIYPDNFVQMAAYAKLLCEVGVEPLPERVLVVNVPRFGGDEFAVKEMGVSQLFENGYYEMFEAALAAYKADVKIKKSRN